MNQEFLELCKKKKVDKEYLKLQKDLTNPQIRSATYCRIGDLAVKLKDFDYALKMYESATKCKQNVPNDVYYTLGNVYLYGTFNKDTTKNIFIEKDIKKAIEIYKKIEDKEESNKLIAYIYYYGLGDSKKNYRKAFKLFKKLNTPCLELGHLYYYGKGMFKKNRYKALEVYSSLKFNKDDEVCNNFIEAMKKVELFKEDDNKVIDLEISNYYLKVLSYKKNHDLIYSFSEILRPLDKNKDIKKLLVKYYKEYLKLVDKIGNRDVNKYINAYEYITPESKRDTFEYKVMKAELGEEKYYFEVGLAYAQGYLMDINKEKSNKYLSKHLQYLEYNLNNIENAKNYIYLCSLLNKDNDNNIYYLEAKALLDDNEYILKVGLAYLYGNITKKDINKARYYLNIYLKALEPYINENNLSKLASYISIYESIYEPKERTGFKYYLAKALLNDPYYKFLVGIAYEEGVEVEKNIEKAKKYIKESYEGGFKGAYTKYQEYFNPKTNYSSISIDLKKANECIKSLELDSSKELTLDSIKSQFRKLSKIYHPDLADPKYKDGKKFIEINDAYNYLNKHYEDINKYKK